MANNLRRSVRLQALALGIPPQAATGKRTGSPAESPKAKKRKTRRTPNVSGNKHAADDDSLESIASQADKDEQGEQGNSMERAYV